MQPKARILRYALAALGAAALLAVPLVSPRGASSAALPQPPSGWSREVVLQNAQRWVDQRVPYSQTSWYRGYRQDCSGFVSMAWNVHASYPTGMMDQIAKPIPKDALLPGDVMLNSSGTRPHVVLFAAWAYSDKSWYYGYEQLSSTNRPVKRLIPYPYFRDQHLYVPYRFTGVPPKPKPAAKAAPSAASKPRPRPASISKAIAGEMPNESQPPLALRLAFLAMFASVGSLTWVIAGRIRR